LTKEKSELLDHKVKENLEGYLHAPWHLKDYIKILTRSEMRT